jgi:hypothetical protein
LITPLRSVMMAPSDAKTSVVAMLMASADVKSQMFEFTLAPPDQLD